MTKIPRQNKISFALSQGAIAMKKNIPQGFIFGLKEYPYYWLNMRNPGLEPGSLCRH